MLKDFFARRKVKRTFEKVVDTETLNALLDNSSLDRPQIESGPYEFVFVFIRQESLEQLSKCIENAVDISNEHGAVVQTVFGQMVILTFGTQTAIKHSPDSRSNLVKALKQCFNDDIKIVHGIVDGHYGLFGGKTRIAYTFTFPRFEEALTALNKLKFGEASEFKT